MRKIVLFAVLAGLIAVERPTAAQSPVPTFKASVAVVPISAVVRDKNGRVVTTLKKEDFEVLDNGQVRPILDFQVDDAGPISLAVLLDVSGSMSIKPKLSLASQVVERLTGDLRADRDEVGFFTFDATLREERPFTVGRFTLNGMVASTKPFGTTSLYDAVAETARRVALRPAQRRAIVVLTDGIDTSSKLTPGEVSALASSIDVPVYVVVTVPTIDRMLNAQPVPGKTAEASADLRDLASWTGGDLLWASEPQETVYSSAQILAELRHQYFIAIESAVEGEWRPLEVRMSSRVRDRRLTVRARTGYFGQRKD
ncbi:MAG TPA: VWA domain-containing protein [Vicinamibacterales bacterium]|nr:VWA domain-containing protein [Vicinamibacterales bacterium]